MQLTLPVSQEGDGVPRLSCRGDSGHLGGGGVGGFGREGHSAGDGVRGVFPPTGIL